MARKRGPTLAIWTYEPRNTGLTQPDRAWWLSLNTSMPGSPSCRRRTPFVHIRSNGITPQPQDAIPPAAAKESNISTVSVRGQLVLTGFGTIKWTYGSVTEIQ